MSFFHLLFPYMSRLPEAHGSCGGNHNVAVPVPVAACVRAHPSCFSAALPGRPRALSHGPAVQRGHGPLQTRAASRGNPHMFTSTNLQYSHFKTHAHSLSWHCHLGTGDVDASVKWAVFLRGFISSEPDWLVMMADLHIWERPHCLWKAPEAFSENSVTVWGSSLSLYFLAGCWKSVLPCWHVALSSDPLFLCRTVSEFIAEVNYSWFVCLGAARLPHILIPKSHFP